MGRIDLISYVFHVQERLQLGLRIFRPLKGNERRTLGGRVVRAQLTS